MASREPHAHRPQPAPVALVTGAARRIGRQIALQLADRGWRVAVHWHRSAAEAEQTVRKIETAGGAALAVQGDLSDPQTPERLVAATADAWSAPSVVVNNASLFEGESLATATADRFDRQMAVNLRAPLLLSQAAAARSRDGQIINIVDWRGLRPVPGHLSYTLAKSALVALTRLLAQELAPLWRVNAIAPGAILPPPGAADSHLAALVGQIPLARHGDPRHVADAVCYLLDADFTTGQIIRVTGGQEL